MTPSIKILIAEDEYLIAFSLATGLKQLGYLLCKPVASGEQAVQHAGQERPDIVLMDLGLAGDMDGLAAARIIIQQYHLPVLFMSGHVDERILEEMAELNPVASMAKPVAVRDLDQAIRGYFTAPG